jgi:2-amino-4-hydroxy-6-hydroxymethyldihydropteridine diphosphokinase
MTAAMSEAFVALGSSIDPQLHLSQAARALKRRFADTRFSACYRNPAFGFEGPDFINAVAAFSTALTIASLLASLREIEAESGRASSDPKWGARAIDLDLLLYGETVGSGPGYRLPRPDLTQRVYMLGPLAELAPERRITPLGPTVAELWARYPRAQYRLEPVELDLNAL